MRTGLSSGWRDATGLVLNARTRSCPVPLLVSLKKFLSCEILLKIQISKISCIFLLSRALTLRTDLVNLFVT